MRKQQTREDALLEAMLQDAIAQCDRRYSPRFVGFLDPRERMLAQNEMKKHGFENYMFWGGFADAERVVFGAFPVYQEPAQAEFPLVPMTVRYRVQDTLCHRDFLGALMALGMERSAVGDILTEPGRCVFFLRKELAPYVLAQIEKIGAVGVSVAEGAEMPYPAGYRTKEISAVVASLRADSVVSVCAGVSREKAKLLIQSGLVSVDYQPCLSASDPLQAGARIAIRGSGKFCLTEADRRTKKGRIGITVEQYLS